MTLDPTFVSNLILVLTGFGGAFLAALWISLVIWTYRDIRTRARDPLVQTLATLAGGPERGRGAHRGVGRWRLPLKNVANHRDRA